MKHVYVSEYYPQLLKTVCNTAGNCSLVMAIHNIDILSAVKVLSTLLKQLETQQFG